MTWSGSNLERLPLRHGGSQPKNEATSFKSYIRDTYRIEGIIVEIQEYLDASIQFT